MLKHQWKRNLFYCLNSTLSLHHLGHATIIVNCDVEKGKLMSGGIYKIKNGQS